jgi:hypothetical protein
MRRALRRTESRAVGLGGEQAAAWERLLTLIGDLNDIKADGKSTLSTHALYEPEAVAAVVTPWTDEDGTRWSVTLRPLLPHERSCADLPEA